MLGKRIMGIDFGLVRVGIAISDKLHIAISTEPTLIYTDSNFWNKIKKIILEQEIGCIVLGTPYNENEEHLMRKHIEEFEHKLQSELETLKLNIPIKYQNESYTSRNAVNTMLEIGKRKKQRSKKGNIDAIAAGLILKQWLEDNN